MQKLNHQYILVADDDVYLILDMLSQQVLQMFCACRDSNSNQLTAVLQLTTMSLQWLLSFYLNFRTIPQVQLLSFLFYLRSSSMVDDDSMISAVCQAFYSFSVLTSTAKTTADFAVDLYEDSKYLQSTLDQSNHVHSNSCLSYFRITSF